MTWWAVTVGADLQIHLGDIIATVTCALLIWIASRLYRLVARFFTNLHDRVADHGERLDETEQRVDEHERALHRWEPLDGPIHRLYRSRRRGDAGRSDEEVVT